MHAPHDNRQGGAPGFGAPPLRAGMSPAGVGPSDAGPLPPSGGRGFGIGRGRGLKGAGCDFHYMLRTFGRYAHMLWLRSEHSLPRFAAAPEQQSDRWGNLGGKERQQGGIGQRLARQYSLDSTVRIFRSLHALPLPAELRDAAVTDPEMLATPKAPANVMQLLAEPLHVASGSLVEDAEQALGPLRPGQAAEHTADQTLSAAGDAAAASASEVQSQPMTLLGNPRAEASADSGPAVAAGHEQIYSYKDPAGAMQVSSCALHRQPVGLCGLCTCLQPTTCMHRAISRVSRSCDGTRMATLAWICLCAASRMARTRRSGRSATGCMTGSTEECSWLRRLGLLQSQQPQQGSQER